MPRGRRRGIRRPDGRQQGQQHLQRADQELQRFGETSRLLLYTDGLVEATGWDGEPFGRQRLRGLLEDNLDHPRKLTQAIYDEISSRQDIDKLEDDVTYLAVEL